MCYYITVAMHEDDFAQLSSVLPEKFRLSPQNHPQLRAMLPSSFLQQVITDRDELCSCRLYRTDHGPLESTQSELEQFIKRKRKAGWSEAKIQRESASRRLTLQKAERDDWVGVHPEIVAALGSAKPTAHGLFLCIHEFGGDLNSEHLKLTRGCMSFSRLNDRTHPTPEDVLWELS